MKRKADRAVESLGEIIDGLRDRGYRFVKVSRLLRDDERYSSAIKSITEAGRIAGLE